MNLPIRHSAGVLADYYRCPEEIDVFAPLHATPLDCGYFRLGPDTVCYGRLSSGSLAKSPVAELSDALGNVRVTASAIHLPFDPSEVLENLRRERYVATAGGQRRLVEDTMRRAYYLARPILPVALRRHLQKLRLRGWERLRFPDWPVDGTIERIHAKLLNLSLQAHGVEEIPFIWFWPDGWDSCAIMTHDVETSSGRDFCADLMDVNDAFEIKSSFQIVPEQRYTVSQRFLDDIRHRGFEINVHDLNHDGHLFSSQAEFERRAERINTYARVYGARGFRSGVLYRNADWYDTFQFAYDMSIPNVAHLDPQRGGCCTVMPYFIGNVLELPVTTTQDYTLFHILCDYSIQLWKAQIDTITAYHGLASFIVHPDYLIPRRAFSIYKELLEYLAHLRAERRIWIALPHQVDSWWRERIKMKLVRHNGDWRIEGQGKERARVAYATLEGDSVHYRLATHSQRDEYASD